MSYGMFCRTSFAEFHKYHNFRSQVLVDCFRWDFIALKYETTHVMYSNRKCITLSQTALCYINVLSYEPRHEKTC